MNKIDHLYNIDCRVGRTLVLPQLASLPLDPLFTMDQVEECYVMSQVHNCASCRSEVCLNFSSALFYLLLNENFGSHFSTLGYH